MIPHNHYCSSNLDFIECKLELRDYQQYSCGRVRQDKHRRKKRRLKLHPERDTIVVTKPQTGPVIL